MFSYIYIFVYIYLSIYFSLPLISLYYVSSDPNAFNGILGVLVWTNEVFLSRRVIIICTDDDDGIRIVVTIRVSSPGFRSRCICLDPDSVFRFLRIRFSNFSGSGSGFQISLDPDPVFKFLLIRIQYSNFSGSGSGFSPRSRSTQKEYRKGSKSYVLEKNP